jgi:hypothetical protein
MVKQVTFKPLPKEAEVHPELIGVDQLTQEERERIQARMAPSAQPSAQPNAQPSAQPESPPPADALGDHSPAVAQLLDASAREVPMTRRSWYVSQAAAEALADAVDEIHHATRGVPKHVIASMLFEMAAADAQTIADHFRQQREQQSATRSTGDTSHA